METIKYKGGYKYQLVETYTVQTVMLGYSARTEWLRLTPDGLLTIYKGYCWDGPSGPTFDTKNFLRPSLVHDAFYNLIRLELLPMSERFIIDKILQYMCLEDGMSQLRAWYVFKAVSWAGGSAASPTNVKKVEEAP